MPTDIGPRIGIQGEKEFRDSLNAINSQLRQLGAEMKTVTAEFDKNENSIEALSAKNAVLKKSIDATQQSISLMEKQQAKYQERLEELGKALDKAIAENGENSREAGRAQNAYNKQAKSITDLQTKIDNATTKLHQFNSALEDNEKYLDEARNSADGHSKSIDEFGNTVENSIDTLSSALAAAGVAAALEEIAGAIRECVNASIEFESAVTGVYKTVEGTPEQLQAISDGIKAMSTEIPATTTEIASVAEAAGQLGIATDDILSFTRVMIDLGESTNLTADEAATALARFANITGTAAEDYERLGSVIVGLGNNFATTEAEITEMATRLASAGTLAGLTESEILALATAMSSVGIEAEAGGTAMTQTLAAIEKAVASGGGSLEQFAEVAGMSVEEFSQAWEDAPVTALQAFITGLGNLESQGKSAVTVLEEMGLSGVRQSNMLQSLALAADTMTGAVELANQAWEENTALADEANKRYATAESQMQMLRNSFTNVQVAIGDALTPALNSLAEAGTDAFSWAADYIEQNPWLVQAITGVVTALGVLTASVTALMVIQKLTPIVQAFNAALAANPAVLVASAIAGLVVALGTLAASTSTVVDETRGLANNLEESRRAYEDTQQAISQQNQDTLTLAASVEKLAATENKTAAEKQVLLNLVEDLNEAVPGLNLVYNELDDTLNMTTEDIQAMVKAMAAQDEAQAAIERMKTLEQEQIQIKTALADAERDLQEAEAERYRLALNGDQNAPGRSQEFEDLSLAINQAEESIAILEEQLASNEQQIDEAAEKYETLQGAIAETVEEMEDAGTETALLSEEVQSLLENYEELEDKSLSLADAEDALTNALTEQKEQGSLTLDTALQLIDAGYARALSIDKETGAIRLNSAAYIALAQSEIKEQLAAAEADRETLVAGLNLQEDAVNALAAANYDLAVSEYKVDEATAGQVAAYDAQIAALRQLQKDLGNYSYTEQVTSRTTSRVLTQAEKDLEKFKDLKAELDHQQAMDLVSEREYYAKLKEYRDAYLTDEENIEEYRRITEQIYEYDKALVDQEAALWEEQTDALVEELQDRVDAVLEQQEKMQSRLAEYGELFQVDDGAMSLENLQTQIDAINQYEEAITALQERGLSESLMGAVLEMDVDEATQYAQQLLALTDEQWNQYNALWEEKQRRAVEVARKFYQDQLDTLKTEYDDKLGQALSELTDTAYTSGQDTAQGLIDGLKAKESALYSQAQKMADRVAEILSSATVSSNITSSNGGTSASVATYSLDGGQTEEPTRVSALSRVASVSDMGRSLSDALLVGYASRQTGQTSASASVGLSERRLISAINNAAASMVNGMSVLSGTERYIIEVHMNVNGKEFYRETIDDLRAVQRSNPEVALA